MVKYIVVCRIFMSFIAYGYCLCDCRNLALAFSVGVVISLVMVNGVAVATMIVMVQ